MGIAAAQRRIDTSAHRRRGRALKGAHFGAAATNAGRLATCWQDTCIAVCLGYTQEAEISGDEVLGASQAGDPG